MKTIPDSVLEKIVEHRPHLRRMAKNLEQSPSLARKIEGDIARAYLAGETRLTAEETFKLAACANGEPYGGKERPTFAENLKRARQRQKLTAEEAAEKCGVARSTWFAYEAGTTTPAMGTLLEIAVKLDTTASKLLQGVTATAAE